MVNVVTCITQAETVDDASIGVFWTTQASVVPGRTLVGHDGVDPGAFTFMYFDPNRKVGVVLLANGDDEVNPSGREQRYVALLDELLTVAEAL